jgi:short-subunit dehydrogenase
MTRRPAEAGHDAAPFTVLITGASSGIGRALAQEFAADGHHLVLVARTAGTLDALAEELARERGVRASALAADLTEAGAAPRLVAELASAELTVDVLVNNAGFGMQGAFAALPVDRQLQMIQLNTVVLTELTRLLLPGMLARRRGGVLNVASTAAFQPGPFMAVYYATKAYVLSFSEALGDEVAGSGVRVTCLAPGPTDTAFAATAGLIGSRLFSGGAMRADDVARVAYAGWQRGESLVIAGRGNRLRALVARFAPRAWVRRQVRSLNTRPPT